MPRESKLLSKGPIFEIANETIMMIWSSISASYLSSGLSVNAIFFILVTASTNSIDPNQLAPAASGSEQFTEDFVYIERDIPDEMMI